MEKTVLVQVREGVATVTLNRADGANALDLAMGRDLLEAALSVEADPAARAVVVTGAGKHFCFGGDLRGMAQKGEQVGGYLNELTTNIHAAISAFTR
ncbi:MAG: 2-(1,2-epoxy,2-dihydrophenyl)acetyl-CoA isomerase, partial [Pseudomonadota bacterium]|nr:2-(1,2-epoxy,2-dihydrophenyl)acetyl-CoA isomerase [Pseudomonadota bacterium]